MIRDHKHVRKYEGTKVYESTCTCTVGLVVPSSVRKYFRTFEGTVHVRVHVALQHKIRVKIKQENVSVTSTNPTIDAHNACQTHPPERRRGERATLRRC
jgi:hypothetical protein